MQVPHCPCRQLYGSCIPLASAVSRSVADDDAIRVWFERANSTRIISVAELATAEAGASAPPKLSCLMFAGLTFIDSSSSRAAFIIPGGPQTKKVDEDTSSTFTSINSRVRWPLSPSH